MTGNALMHHVADGVASDGDSRAAYFRHPSAQHLSRCRGYKGDHRADPKRGASMWEVQRMKTLATFLAGAGIATRRMDEKEIWRAQQSWRKSYSTSVKEMTSRWKYKGLDWHTFSYGFKKAVTDGEAEAEYGRLADNEFIIIGGAAPYGYRCKGHLPNLRKMRKVLTTTLGSYNCYLMAPDMSWTMVLTHEDDPRIAQFFSQQDWPTSSPNLGRAQR